MKSIRKRLTLSLIIGLGLVWIVSQGFVLQIVRQASISVFDNELYPINNDVQFYALPFKPFDDPSREDNSQRAIDFSEENSGLYFQIFNADRKTTLKKSPSLGNIDLPFTDHQSDNPRFWNQKLPNGEKVRIVALRFELLMPPNPFSMRPPRRPFEKPETITTTLLIARNRDELDKSIAFTALVLVAVGVACAIITVVLVNLLLGKGLKPLHRFSSKHLSRQKSSRRN